MMSATRDRQVAELTVVLAEALPGHEHVNLAWRVVGPLLRAARAYGRLQELACSRELTGREVAREARLEREIRALVSPLAVTFGGDPRGFTVKVVLPSGRSNTWGNDGWGVPGS
jgi:hypothetical protein